MTFRRRARLRCASNRHATRRRAPQFNATISLSISPRRVLSHRPAAYRCAPLRPATQRDDFIYQFAFDSTPRRTSTLRSAVCRSATPRNSTQRDLL